jgi:hypothetical protein
MLRIPHCLDNRLTDGGKVVSQRNEIIEPTNQRHVQEYWSGNTTGIALQNTERQMDNNKLTIGVPMKGSYFR